VLYVGCRRRFDLRLKPDSRERFEQLLEERREIASLRSIRSALETKQKTLLGQKADVLAAQRRSQVRLCRHLSIPPLPDRRHLARQAGHHTCWSILSPVQGAERAMLIATVQDYMTMHADISLDYLFVLLGVCGVCHSVVFVSVLQERFDRLREERAR
jgi:hypothetical protein